LSDTFLYITAALYLVSTLVFIAYLVTHKDSCAKAGKYILFAGLSAHTAVILLRWVEGGRFPATSLHESLALFAWFVILVYAVVTVKYKMTVLGAFAAPFALFLILTASLLPMEIVPLAPVLTSYWLPVHVTLAILGNAFFALACLLGIMYLIQDHYLKSRKLGGLYFVLPSLEVLDELNYRFLTYGFPLLTLGIITGAVWSEYSFGTYWQWQHRQVWSLITWFLYAALLHGRLTTGWRGRKSALYSVLAFLILLGSSFIIYTLLGEGHGLLRDF
jgi:cytochrome c-type biogenesis protein CcsB